MMSGDSYSERSSMARVRANRSMAQRQPPSHSLSNQSALPPPPPPPPPSSVQAPASSSQKTNQEKALITLLGEMRDLEKRMNAQAAEFEAERQQFQETINQQKQQMESLEASKNQAEYTLRKVFTQLDRFSQGCWEFPSNSVKKMSEALHTQLLEWRRTINEEELDPEEQFMEKSAMEKMQTLHLEVKQLREENLALKKQTRDNRKANYQRGASSRSTSSRSGLSGGGEDDDQSNLSGMSSTILSGMMESPRMTEAMSGFLRSPTKPRTSSRKNRESPTSILKQSSRFDSRNEENTRRNGGAYQQRTKPKPSVSLPPRLPQNHNMTSSGKKVARFAGVDDVEFECDWGEAESEV